MVARTPTEEQLQGAREARWEFLEMVGDVRPQLHRYCTRLLGSVLDAEDVVQDTLATAYYKLPVVREPRDLRAWLFRVAHNRAMDELRRRKVRAGEGEEAPEVGVETHDPVVREQAVGKALETMLGHLPPQERACLVLKEVMEFSLQEIAEIVGSSVGAVKAAIHRGRGKLKAGTVKSSTAVPRPRRASTPEHRQLLAAYAQCFNSRSWDDLVRLLAADARLEVLEVYDGLGSVSFTDRYCFNYSRFDFEWRFRLDEVEGETLLVVERFFDDRPEVFSVVRLWGRGGEVTRVRDYLHVPPYLLEALGIEPTQPLAPVGAR